MPGTRPGMTNDGLTHLQKRSSRLTIAAGGQRWTPRRAATPKSTRAGSATRPDSGARRPRRSTGSRSRRPCSIRNAGVYGRWFPDGVCNTCYNAVDRHVEAGRGTQPAIIYDSPVTGTKQTITYAALQTKTEMLAGILKHHFGVQKGDRVILYMPMVPEALVGMLACARIGAVHSVVFGGFAPKELATRIDDAKPKVILSASCGIEAARVIAYKPLLDAAIDLAKHKPDGLPDPAAAAAHLRADARPRPRLAGDLGRGAGVGEESARAGAAARHRSALHPLHLGHHRHPQGRRPRQRRPHGRAAMVDEESLRHRAGRDLVGGSDIGWVVGHSYIVYAPLFHGAPRSSTRASRSARPTPARSGASSPSTARSRSSPRRPRSAPSRRKTPRASCSPNTICRNSARCSSPASAPIPTPSSGPSGC